MIIYIYYIHDLGRIKWHTYYLLSRPTVPVWDWTNIGGNQSSDAQAIFLWHLMVGGDSHGKWLIPSMELQLMLFCLFMYSMYSVNIKNMFWLDIIWFAHIFLLFPYFSIFCSFHINFWNMWRQWGNHSESHNWICLPASGSRSSFHTVHSTMVTAPTSLINLPSGYSTWLWKMAQV